jgi:hypothetical protein
MNRIDAPVAAQSNIGMITECRSKIARGDHILTPLAAIDQVVDRSFILHSHLARHACSSPTDHSSIRELDGTWRARLTEVMRGYR